MTITASSEPLGSEQHCAVLHAPGYVPGACSGEIHLYRALTSTARYWLCDLDAERSTERGMYVELVR